MGVTSWKELCDNNGLTWLHDHLVPYNNASIKVDKILWK